jgi:hypothetical protein
MLMQLNHNPNLNSNPYTGKDKVFFNWVCLFQGVRKAFNLDHNLYVGNEEIMQGRGASTASDRYGSG